MNICGHILTIFSLFFSKIELKSIKSIKIKANNRSFNKYIKTQEYYNILLSILKTGD